MYKFLGFFCIVVGTYFYGHREILSHPEGWLMMYLQGIFWAILSVGDKK